MVHKNLVRAANAHKNALDGNFSFVHKYKNALSALKASQSPKRYMVMCGDSRCMKSACMGNQEDVGDTFGGPGPVGNVVTNFTLTGLAFNIDHLETPYMLVCGHTGCAAIEGSMGDFSGERPIVQKAFKLLNRDYTSVQYDPQLDHLDDCTANAFKNVQAQVLKVVDTFKEEVASGKFTVLGAIYDNQGVFGDEGLIHYYSLNGNTNVDDFMAHDIMSLTQDDIYAQQVRGWRK
ncbi:MAG: carbonic anhydrase [Alphaproteobacteria bacterium]|jgi:carbonic anhydrase